MNKLLAAIAITFGLIVGMVANPGLASANIPVHAWNTTPQPPRLFFGSPVAYTTFTTGEGTNATLVATCLLKFHDGAKWEHDGCGRTFWDFDRTGTDSCWYSMGQDRWIGYFVTQTWIAIHHANGTNQTIALYSEPVELTCHGGKST